MSLAGRITAELEIHQRGDGSWNWVLIQRDNVHEPAFVLWDSTAHRTPQEALIDGDRFMLAQLGEKPAWI